MVNTLRKIYNKTPWQQKRLSQPLNDPNYVASPLQHSSIYEEEDTDNPSHQEHLESQHLPLQRHVSIAEPNHNKSESSNTQHNHPNPNNNGSSGDGNNNGKDHDTNLQPRRVMTRADTKISLRKSKKDSRRVFVNIPPPSQYLDKTGAPKLSFGSNRIKTAKYTTLSFLPKNLFEQFRRVANMFFLFMAIIQLTPTFTVGSPFLTVFPLCFVVGVTAIKDGFEDYKRHVEDRNYNQRLCLQLQNVVNYNFPTDAYLAAQKDRNVLVKIWSQVVHGASTAMKKTLRATKLAKVPTREQIPLDLEDLVATENGQDQRNQEGTTQEDPISGPQPEFVKEQWANLRVGDIIMLKNNQAVPADAIILSTSEAEGSCFIETKDLDGETNLKTRMSLHETSKYNTARRCSRLKCYVDMEPINANLFTFNGSLTMLARKRHVAGQRGGRSANNRYSVYAPSITSSMMSSVRGSMDEGREYLEDLPEGDYGTENEPQLPAQGGTSASEYARLHRSSTHKRRSRLSMPLDEATGPAPGDKQEYEEPTPGDKHEYDEHDEGSHEGGRYLEASSSLRATISKRSSLHRAATTASVGGTSGMAKNVLKAQYEHQLRHQSQDDRPIRREISGVSTVRHGGGAQYKETTIPVDINNMLLRGHVIRNTHWIIAVIAATGTDTKIMLNSGETPSKRSRIEKTMNIQVALNFGILLILCIVCAIGSTINDRRWRNTTAQQLWDASTRGVVTEGVITFFTSLIIFQNIIPISLYISIEFVKTFQAYFIWKDSDMYDVDLDEFCTPKTWNLTDDLGQIEYVFSDKTGTLTRNIMEFKKCTINGKIYGNNAVAGKTDGEKGIELMSSGAEPGQEEGNHGQLQSSGGQHRDADKEAVLKEYDQEIRKLFKPVYMDALDSLSFADPELLRDMAGHGTTAGDNGEGSSNLNQTVTRSAKPGHQEQPHDGSPTSNIRDFFTLLALCHTVVVEQPEEEIEDDDGDEFGLYDDSGSPEDKSGVDGNANQQKSGLSFGLRDKLKQKAEAAGLTLPGTSAKASGTRSRGNSNAGSVPPRDNGSGSQQGTSPDGSVDDQTPTLQYRAESPDEAALVSAAKNVGFVFVSRGAAPTQEEGSGKKGSGGNSRQNVNVNFLGQDYTFEQLDVIKFNSTRKRMTVIVREPEELGGKILLLTKGADNVIFERLGQDNDDQALRDQTEHDIETFSSMGLRTLTLAQRVLDQATYDAWSAKYAEAGKALDDRAKKMDQVAEEIEKDLTLIGATAIEDKLQEGVPDSIAALREAGIKVWVLTGDKLETAINIGFASRLLEKDMKLEIMKMGRNEPPDHVLKRFKQLVEGVLSGRGNPEENEGSTAKLTDEQMQLPQQPAADKPLPPAALDPNQDQFQLPDATPSPWHEKTLPPTPSDTSLEDSDNLDQQQQHALIVDGSALKILLDDPDARKDLIKLSDVCFSVICCRASPLQKALVVELIRRGKKTVCLAIGDGANDVSMIQAANIGVGIAGQEGMQAAMASDYSITQFRFIKKLVLVHGHWGYMRIAEMILNFFFKNVLWVAAVLWFQIYCGFSANLFYDYTFVSLYNLMLTAVPVLVLGATDQDVTAPYVLRFPGVYKLGILQKRYNQYRFIAYMLDGVWQSLIVFWFWRGVYGMNMLSTSGIDGSLLEFSTSVAITNVVIASLYVGLHTYHWTWIMHFAVWGSITFLALMILIYGAFTASPIYHVAIRLFSEGPFWFMLILAVVTAFLLRFTVLFISFWWYPDDVHVVRGIMISEKRKAIADNVKWTGLAPDGMTPQEQSEQEKAILRKEDAEKAAKEEEKARRKAAREALKHGGHHQQDDSGQSYDLTMVHINVDDQSQELSSQGNTLVAARRHDSRMSSSSYENKPAALPPVPSPSLPSLPTSSTTSKASLHAHETPSQHTQQS
ncbi:hypothetical protein B0O80DRAFT_485445 [Mortierella sp. GBAus27b]|nr:hypothetical protein BGX31_001208 [Mortierella sp. GBA43]KAI8357413.1 hypothetical protein B0O80DRAFT_485445 [Mortierella sp. GBAus27b]